MTLDNAEIRRRHGHIVKTIRDEQELSQDELADMAECSQQTISRIERGIHTASDDLRVRISKALGEKTVDVFPYYEDEKAAAR